MENLKIIIVTQARVNSTRLPGKVLKKIGNETLLSLHLKRLKASKKAQQIVVATTNENRSEEIINIAVKENVSYYQGSTEDVLDRFYQSVVNEAPDFVVRVTSDCPLIDASLVDKVIDMTVINDVDYGSNILLDEFPDGQDIEVIRWEAFSKAWSEATLKSDREHVTPFIRRNADFNGGLLFKAKNLNSTFNYSKIRMTVDELHDLEAVQHLVKTLGPNKGWQEYADYIVKNLDLFNNQEIIRNEGFYKSLLKDQ